MRFLALLLILGLVACHGPEESPSIEKVTLQVLTHGEEIELKPHLVNGKITVFDFYADWCPPCKKLDRSLVSLKNTYSSELEVFKLDLVNWDSALAKQYGIKDLPYLIVYDANGELMEEGPSAGVLPKLIAALSDGG